MDIRAGTCYNIFEWKVSSVGEHSLDVRGVVGSSPIPSIFSYESVAMQGHLIACGLRKLLRCGAILDLYNCRTCAGSDRSFTQLLLRERNLEKFLSDFFQGLFTLLFQYSESRLIRRSSQYPAFRLLSYSPSG